MSCSSFRRTALLSLLSIPFATGCGSGAAPNGSQINVTIPKEEAVKQNQAYQDYSKQRPKSNLSPNQTQRQKR